MSITEKEVLFYIYFVAYKVDYDLALTWRGKESLMSTYNETGLHYGTSARGVFLLLSFFFFFHCGGHSLEFYTATWRPRAPTSNEAPINQSIN